MSDELCLLRAPRRLYCLTDGNEQEPTSALSYFYSTLIYLTTHYKQEVLTLKRLDNSISV